MRHILCCLMMIAAGATLAAAGSASAASITYNLIDMPEYQDGYTLSGTITTDGLIGNLTPDDVTSWSVTISKGAGSYTFSSGAGATITLVNVVYATDTEIRLLPVQGVTYYQDALGLYGPGGSGGTGDLIQWAMGQGTNGLDAAYDARTDGGGTVAWHTTPDLATDSWAIARVGNPAVPEPSSATMATIAAIAVGATVRRRCKSS